MQRGYSLAGHLYMKNIGGALTLLRAKKKYYFAIDEISGKLLYFKDENDLIIKKDPVGELSLSKAVFTTVDNNPKAFVMHIAEKSIELEAENENSCRRWMETLVNRDFDDENMKAGKMSRASGAPFRRIDRTRSISLPMVDHISLMEKNNNTLNLNDVSRKEALRKYSSPISIDSPLALSVLEEKLNELNGKTESLKHRSTAQPAPINNTQYILDEWVTKWLQQQKFTEDESDFDSSTVSSNSVSVNDPMSTTENERNETCELEQLRRVSNEQKKRLEYLIQQNRRLTEEVVNLKLLTEDTPENQSALSAQNRFLNSEILRMNEKCLSMEKNIESLRDVNVSLKSELDMMKKEYVFALQSTIRIPLKENSAMDTMQVKLLGGDVHKYRICKLVAEIRAHEPSLPTLQSLLSGVYVDSFGFRISLPDEKMAIHYMATKINEYYENKSDSAILHRKMWKKFLEENEYIEITPESVSLCRNGIPNSLRSTVWNLLIHQTVADLKVHYGKYYYRNLCNTQEGEEDNAFSTGHQKQIHLDLLRTMPNNVHFMTASSKGVTQLLQVLRAFCLHNDSLGYCQGMNFLAATALLFVGPEEAFWFLIAVTERYFDKTYFDDNLAGAQADQEVLKELLEEYCPEIANHLASLDIELASITLNWFIALFFDAVPFSTLLRLWDCFMLEGPKVLFHFGLALLIHHKEEILAESDTIGIMRVVRAAGKLAFDINRLFKIAFEDLEKIPSHEHLRSKHKAYLEDLQERLNKRTKLRNYFNSTSSSIHSCDLSEMQISDVYVSEFSPDIAYAISGSQSRGEISRIKTQNGKATAKGLEIEFDCRIASFVLISENTAIVGLISGFIVALSVNEEPCAIQWEIKLPDVALKLLYNNKNLYAALANGTLTVLENICDKWPNSLEMYHLPIGYAPLADAAIYDETLIVASACKMIKLELCTLSAISTVYVACANAAMGTPMFEKVSCLSPSSCGVFLCTANSTLLQLWTDTKCTLLFDISKPSLSSANSDEESTVHISSLLALDDHIWLGTSDGYVMIYALEKSKDYPKDSAKYTLKTYPSGRRIAPKISATNIPVKTTCYIPTNAETQRADSEDRSVKEEMLKSRVSINIDRDTQQYSVSITSLESKQLSPERKESNSKMMLRRNSTKNGQTWNNGPVTRPRRSMQKGVSIDSAVSVFSSENASGADYVLTTHEHEMQQCSRNPPNCKMNKKFTRLSSTGSSYSMEYEDIFELYSDEERSRRKICIPRNSRPTCSSYSSMGQTSTSDSMHSKLKIRRKDLSFDDPLIVACSDRSTMLEANKECELSEIIPSLGLTLLMKLKVSDKPVRKIRAMGKSSSNSMLLTCAGTYNDEESLLLWNRDADSGLWINDPVIRLDCPNSPSLTTSTARNSVSFKLA
ncbi:hypothetical protein WR25_10566 [Diploscapter pachys]|uniref:TBC1 domain family member 2B n=1 Tax=Diploscapter pachys TaxID=2018661 RepID=A0A2A2JTI6_9BILA|nr:hypothetical protein WR25_10566 [Diploscapter pachys]